MLQLTQKKLNNIFIQNSLYAIVFKLPVILLFMECTDKLETSHYLALERDTQVTHHVVAMKKVAQ